MKKIFKIKVFGYLILVIAILLIVIGFFLLFFNYKDSDINDIRDINFNDNSTDILNDLFYNMNTVLSGKMISKTNILGEINGVNFNSSTELVYTFDKNENLSYMKITGVDNDIEYIDELYEVILNDEELVFSKFEDGRWGVNDRLSFDISFSNEDFLSVLQGNDFKMIDDNTMSFSIDASTFVDYGFDDLVDVFMTIEIVVVDNYISVIRASIDNQKFSFLITYEYYFLNKKVNLSLPDVIILPPEEDEIKMQ